MMSFFLFFHQILALFTIGGRHALMKISPKFIHNRKARLFYRYNFLRGGVNSYLLDTFIGSFQL